eukprot:993672-Pelagomonas_calceolata.AAC.1
MKEKETNWLKRAVSPLHQELEQKVLVGIWRVVGCTWLQNLACGVFFVLNSMPARGGLHAAAVQPRSVAHWASFVFLQYMVFLSSARDPGLRSIDVFGLTPGLPMKERSPYRTGYIAVDVLVHESEHIEGMCVVSGKKVWNRLGRGTGEWKKRTKEQGSILEPMRADLLSHRFFILTCLLSFESGQRRGTGHTAQQGQIR